MMRLERLLCLRKKNELTQEYVAHRLHVSRRAYSHYEGGTRQMPLDVLDKCATIFETSTDYLLNRTDETDPLPPPKDKKSVKIRY